MSKIYITGDLHGAAELVRFRDIHLNKDDVMLQLGDAGLIWEVSNFNEENKWLNWFEHNFEFKLLCVLGNHENYDRIKNLEVVNVYGADCYKVRENIYYIKNGEILTINDKKFIALGGALSIDRDKRIEGVSWWRDEEMNYSDQERILNNLESPSVILGKTYIDYILSHTAPKNIIDKYFRDMGYSDSTSRFLEHINNVIMFEKWYFGHFHIDKDINEYYTCLYKTIEELKQCS